MRDDPLEGLEHVWSIIDEVRDLQLCAMDGLLGSSPARASDTQVRGLLDVLQTGAP